MAGSAPRQLASDTLADGKGAGTGLDHPDPAIRRALALVRQPPLDPIVLVTPAEARAIYRRADAGNPHPK